MSENNNNAVDNEKEKRAKAKAEAAAAAEAARKQAAISAEADAKVNAAFDANIEAPNASATEPSEVTQKQIADTQAAEKQIVDTQAAEKEKEAAALAKRKEAAQNVMYQKEFGSGLDALAAMQDPNYEVGSGSSLLKPARSIGPRSGGFRRASRRLRRQGYGAAAQQMAMAGEIARMGESSIDTPAARGQRMTQRIIAGRETQKQDKILTETEKRAKEAEERRASIQQPLRLRDYRQS